MTFIGVFLHMIVLSRKNMRFSGRIWPMPSGEVKRMVMSIKLAVKTEVLSRLLLIRRRYMKKTKHVGYRGIMIDISP